MNIKDAIRQYRLVGVLGRDRMQIVDTDEERLVVFGGTALPLRYFEALMIYATMSVHPTGETYERFAKYTIEFWDQHDCRPDDIDLTGDDRYSGWKIIDWFKDAIKIRDCPKELAEYYTDNRELSFWTYISKREEADVKSTQG